MALLLAPYIMHGSGGAWTPLSDGYGIAWWDASDEATITDSGGAVSAWADKAGANDFSTFTGTMTTGNATYDENGLNTIYASGGSMAQTGFPTPASGNLMISMAVSVISSAGSNRSMISMDGGQDWQFDSSAATAEFYGLIDCTFASNIGNETVGYADGTLRIWQLVFDRTNSDMYLYIDGTLKDSTTDYNTAMTATTLYINANRGNNQYIEAAYGEIAMTEAVDATTRGDYYTYLSGKWIA